jgi:NADH-quinone oxidoreductase subunit D
MKKDKSTTLYLGPQHPGITGNMMVKLQLEGDTIVKATTHVGYLHRAFEKLMERRNWLQSFTILCRMCVPEPDPNEENYARAVEEIEGREVPERAKYIRVMVLELARLASLLLWYAGQPGSAGLYTMGQWSVGDRNYILDLFEDLTGGRIYHMYIWPGGVRRDLPKGFKDRALKVMDYLEKRWKDYDRLLFDNAIFQKRAKGVGIIDAKKAIEWGVVGPPLRGCGIKSDVRIDEPYEVYDKLDFEVPDMYKGGDVWARAQVRRFEFLQSIKIVRQVLDEMPGGEIFNPIPNPHKWKIPKGDALIKTETVRGESSFYVVSDGTNKPRRIHLKGPAFVHGMTLLEDVLVGQNLADVSFIMNSLGTCPPEMER